MILYEEILRAFQKQKVKYIIVGGIAINLHGFLRNTSDLDILVDMTDDNLKKIVNILKKIGYRVKRPVDPMGIADKKTRHDWIHNKNMKAFNFYKEDEFKEVDIIIESPVSYKKAHKNALRLKINDVELPIISLDDLIEMKKHAGKRPGPKRYRTIKENKEIMKTEINFGWETDEDRLRRWVKLSPKEKMKWLYEAHELMRKVWTKKQKEAFWKMRQSQA